MLAVVAGIRAIMMRDAGRSGILLPLVRRDCAGAGGWPGDRGRIAALYAEYLCMNLPCDPKNPRGAVVCRSASGGK
jgi:hypothetical protein